MNGFKSNFRSSLKNKIKKNLVYEQLGRYRFALYVIFVTVFLLTITVLHITEEEFSN